jgi:hypothetical protein
VTERRIVMTRTKAIVIGMMALFGLALAAYALAAQETGSVACPVARGRRRCA